MLFRPGGLITESLNKKVSIIPEKFSLEQNYPNPFNPSTKITYLILERGPIKLSVFDMSGKLIRVLVNEIKSAGSYSIDFNGSDIASGTYLYLLENGQNIASKKMILLK